MSKKEELDRDAIYQRRRMMTRDERAIEARDTVAKNIHEQNQRDGKRESYDSALAKATEIAHKKLRIDQENG